MVSFFIKAYYFFIIEQTITDFTDVQFPEALAATRIVINEVE